jgi:hypothetical protein
VKSTVADGAAFKRVWVVFCCVALLATFLMFGLVYTQPRPVINAEPPVSGEGRPCEIVAFLRENNVKGNLYNPLWWGPYITWELHPDIRVAMDGRNISLFPRDMVLENLRYYSTDATLPDSTAPLKYDTDFLLVPASLPITSRTLDDPRWLRVFGSRDWVLLVRAERAGKYPSLASAEKAAANSVAPDCPDLLQ